MFTLILKGWRSEKEFVVATEEPLHELARQLGIMHLIYAGFATNWCILNRDYGMWAMAQRGWSFSIRWMLVLLPK